MIKLIKLIIKIIFAPVINIINLTLMDDAEKSWEYHRLFK